MPPYIKAPPSVIRIDTGRQLFVDSFLIDTMTGATRDFHSLEYSDRNPVLSPDVPWEKSCHCYTCCDGKNGLPVGEIDGWAAPFSGTCSLPPVL